MTKSRFKLGRRGFLPALTSGLACIGCERPGYSETIPHLFACGEGDLSVLARKALGRKLDRDDIFRNSTGSRVYLTAAYTNREILVLSADNLQGSLWLPLAAGRYPTISRLSLGSITQRAHSIF